MPVHRGQRAVTCDDCYFRQELLCALQLEKPCPTFRATVGRAPEAPRQAQLVPVGQLTVPTRGDGVGLSLAPAFESGEPFAAMSAEATFSLSDADPSHTVVQAREALEAPRASVSHIGPVAAQAAAAARQSGVSCVVECDDGAAGLPAPTAVGDEPAVRLRGTRVARVAQRVAQRYPNALRLC